MAKHGRRIVLAAALMLITAVACKGDGKGLPTSTATLTRPPSATALQSPTSTPPATSAASFRDLAAGLQAALDNRDTTFLDDRIKLATGTCTEADVQGGIGAAPCTTVGAPWAAFPAGYWRSEGSYIDFDGGAFLQGLYDMALPSESDAFGDGALQVYALSMSDTSAATVITEVIDRPANFGAGGPLRIVRVLSWTYDEGRWKASFLLNASVLSEEFLIPCQAALDYLGGAWERFPDPDATGGPGADACLEGH